MLDWMNAHLALIAYILGGVVVVDHYLASNTKIAASSSFQLITKVLDWLYSLIKPKAPPAMVILLPVALFLSSCGQEAVNHVPADENDVPAQVVDTQTGKVYPVDQKKVILTKENTKQQVREHMEKFIAKVRFQHSTLRMSEASIVDSATQEYMDWLHAQEQDASEPGEYIWQKVKQGFEYSKQIDKLYHGVKLLVHGIVCDEDYKKLYIQAMEDVAGVSVEIIVGIICAANDPSFGLITTFVCMPIGNLGGSALGKWIIGPFVFKQICGF